MSIIHAQHVHSDDLCLKKSDGSEACITGDQLTAMAADGAQMAVEGIAGAPAATPASGDAGSATSTTAANDNLPPVIQISGNNPATINIGDAYQDLGATITGPTADLNLGIHLYIDGIATGAAQLDASVVGTHLINYVVSDSSGLTSTSTRTVIVTAANDNPQPQGAEHVA